MGKIIKFIKTKYKGYRENAPLRAEERRLKKERREKLFKEKLDRQIEVEKRLSKIRKLRKQHMPKPQKGRGIRETARAFGRPPVLGGLSSNDGFGSSGPSIPTEPMQVLPDFDLFGPPKKIIKRRR